MKFAILMCLWLWLGACSSAMKSSVDISSALAVVTLEKLDNAAYPYDKIHVVFKSTADAARSYEEVLQKGASGTVNMTVPAGPYKITLEYLAGPALLLSNALCAQPTMLFDLLPRSKIAVNSIKISLCAAGIKDNTPVQTPSSPGAPSSGAASPAHNNSDVAIQPVVAVGGVPFLEGINVAWVDFARDIGGGAPNLSAFKQQFAALGASGGTIARLWVHTNGAVTPEFRDGLVVGPGSNAIGDLITVLDLARDAKIKLILTLWSFDMLVKDYEQEVPGIVARNRRLLTDTAALDSYLDQALTPIVNAIKDHPGLHSFEVCNEPEGMTDAENWSMIDSNDRVAMSQVQTFVGKIAGRIRALAPQALITNGSVSLKYLSALKGSGNFYTDKALIAASGDPLGYLSYYQAHYYAKAGKEVSPFLHKASEFGFDKPVLIGEFYLQEYGDDDVGTPRELYAKLQTMGYYGALGWKDGTTDALNLMVDAMTYCKNPLAP